ncbi:hypothetical protein OSB04_006153 [Centaurea solstitialis]|uniref:Uncharacterized protein n=1 Tax=Centaurea solstitialis TaxID=347529 RepID=A0AA38U201_9ASTR|nr:hypothetical protein OSB04_006153 [Centaurea solstitialis]
MGGTAILGVLALILSQSESVFLGSLVGVKIGPMGVGLVGGLLEELSDRLVVLVMTSPLITSLKVTDCLTNSSVFDGWDKLKEKGITPELHNMFHERSRHFLLGRLKKIGPDEYVLPKHTQSLADKLIQKDRQISQGDGDPKLGDDPLVAVLGPEHPCRTRGLRVGLGHGDKKRKKKEKANLEEEIAKAVRLAMQEKQSEWEEHREQDKREWEERMEQDRRTWQESTQNLKQQLKMALAGQLGTNNVSPDGSPGVHKSSAGSTACVPQMLSIEYATPCNLIVYCKKAKVVVAKGMAYPLVDSIVHGAPLQDGFIKVSVELVINGWEGFELPVPLPNDGVETLGQALGTFIQWEQEYAVLQQAPTTNKNIFANDMMPSSSAPKSVFLPNVPPKSAHIPHQVQKEDEAQSKRVVVATELGSKKQVVKKLKPLPKEIQNRPAVMKDLFRRLRSNAEWVKNGVTVQIDVGVFGPTNMSIGVQYDDLKHHWSLLIVRPRHRLVYILDSLMSEGKTVETYRIKEIMEMAITKYNNYDMTRNVVTTKPVTWKLNPDIWTTSAPFSMQQIEQIACYVAKSFTTSRMMEDIDVSTEPIVIRVLDSNSSDNHRHNHTKTKINPIENITGFEIYSLTPVTWYRSGAEIVEAEVVESVYGIDSSVLKSCFIIFLRYTLLSEILSTTASSFGTILPSSMLTTADIEGLSVGEIVVHTRARFATTITSWTL